MIICISGLTGSGKDTVAGLVAKKLGLPHVNPTFKTYAKEKGLSLLEFQKENSDGKFDREFDAKLLAEVAKTGGNCVVSTWLGPWIIKQADIRVRLHAPVRTRATRIAKRDGTGV